jgi:riboflavin synthase
MRIGIADTTFARVDMGKYALEALQGKAEIERYTVPGFKDLAVAAKKLIEEYHCDAVVALGWAGSAPIDEQCAMEANIALMQAELMTNKHILKVFIFESESEDKEKLVAIAKDRAAKHALNALTLLQGKEALSPEAGRGLRQGQAHRGPL